MKSLHTLIDHIDIPRAVLNHCINLAKTQNLPLSNGIEPLTL